MDAFVNVLRLLAFIAALSAGASIGVAFWGTAPALAVAENSAP